MKRISAGFWVVMVLLAGLLLWRCGHKNNNQGAVELPDVGPSVPSDWNGEDDWSGNALHVEDITP